MNIVVIIFSLYPSLDEKPTDFRKQCVTILQDVPPDAKSMVSSSPDKRVQKENWDSITELALVVSPHPSNPKRFKSHSFNPEDIISLSNRISKKDLEDNINKILKCPNLRVLCIHGVGTMFEEEPVRLLADKLPVSCPLIQHFILDDSDIMLAKTYTKTVKMSHVKVLEVKNADESEGDLIQIINNSPKLCNVILENSPQGLLDIVVPKVTALTVSWITQTQFKHLTEVASRSSILELHLNTVDLKIDSEAIACIAKSLPNLQTIEIASGLQNIVHLSQFESLMDVIWDADVIMDTEIDPFLPNSLKIALDKMDDNTVTFPDSPMDSSSIEEENDQDKKNESDTKEESQSEELSPQVINYYSQKETREIEQKNKNQVAFNHFLQECGPRLRKFSLTLRNRYKKDFFINIKKSCPNLQELKIVTTLEEQFFDSKHLCCPSLKSLSLSGIVMTDVKLLDLLDHCIELEYLQIDMAKRLTTLSVFLTEQFVNSFWKKENAGNDLSHSSESKTIEGDSSLKSNGNKTGKRFMAKISTDGPVGSTEVRVKRVFESCLIDFLQRQPPVVTNKIRQHYK